MSQKICIIGGGPGGYVAALRAAQLGAEVTLIEGDKLGGVCLNRGCIPSKIMRHTAELLEKLHRAREFGLEIKGDFHADLKLLMERKERVIQNQEKGILRLLAHHKINYLRGFGTIEAPHCATVKLLDGKLLEAPWDSLILAPGARPADIPAFPFDGKRILSSDHALDLHEAPESILIVGGGVIGCEFAFILNALGSQVTVVEAFSRMLPLPSVDEDCSKTLQREMKKRKIGFMVNRTVERIEEKGGKIRITIAPSTLETDSGARDRGAIIKEAAKMLVCIGRAPNSAGIGLERIGVKTDEKGWIVADERMETSVSGVYAVGDVLGPSRGMLAHVASTEGRVAAENAVGGTQAMDYRVAPVAIFTMPEVANVGLTEARAREQGYQIRADRVLFRNLGKAQVIGELAGEVKIVSDAENGKILGVHIVGPHATDLIAEGALAIQSKCTVKDLAQTIHAHPTLSEIMLEASLKAMDEPLHG